MIASFAHDFIFVKTRKVGGTSLEIVLSSWCGEADICSPITTDDEEIRRAYGGRAQNYRDGDGSIRFFNHMPAAEIAEALPDLWSTALKFTVDRHPYEKVVSRAWWNIGKRGRPESEFASEIDKAIDSKSYLNWPLYAEGGQVLVDEVWRYEDMWSRLDDLAAKLSLPAPRSLPQAKGQHRKDRRPAQEILTSAQRRRIHEDARFEFELLGYQP